MNTDELISFLLEARANTYAAGGGKVAPLLPGSKQLEYIQADWLYRDIYNIGNGIFPGIETVYLQNKPLWSMSYFGDFSKMTEDEADTMLRKALMDNRNATRTWHKIDKDYGDFRYICEGSGSIEVMSGMEKILKGDELVYYFQYAGGFIGPVDE